MRKWFLYIIFLTCLVLPVSAMEFQAPLAPDSAQIYMPDEQETFGEGLWYIVRSALAELRPEIANASELCLSMIIVVLLLRIAGGLSERSAGVLRLVCAVILGIMFLEPANTMIRLGANTVAQISEYGKLLIPVMTAAIAAQGGATTSAVLYTGTVFFNSLLTSFITGAVVPALYIYLCLCIAWCATAHETIKNAQNLLKWLITWSLKWVLYIFTAYVSITGVVSGTVDASALKAAKITLSGAVPVVGNILADATETILVSAGIMKNSAGIYGIFAILAICVGPFVQIGVQYILLKLTGAICGIFNYKPGCSLVKDFSVVMGFVLAMTGTVCVLLLVSIVCFMRGMG